MSDPWHTLTSSDAAERLGVDPARGLTDDEATSRLAEHGANQLPQSSGDPLWRRLLDLLTEPMTVVLLVAALVAAVVSGELETPVAILVVVVLNGVLNLMQERRAETALHSLEAMSVTRARVRRGGSLRQLDAADLVPGDVVLLEAGDAVPADGRILQETGLEVEESALTGESAPAAKDRAAVPDPTAALGDRADMVFLGTEVTRGRGAVVVTATGTDTEMGRVARMLESAGQDLTPLQRRIAHLARLLSGIAAAVVLTVVVLGLARGLDLTDVMLLGVSLAVATIPEGLTAVVAFTLAMGAARLARKGAILKDLASVETLGSTSHIATDKTGTLTLNQMTARRFLTGGRDLAVTGEGYSTEGQVAPEDAVPRRTGATGSHGSVAPGVVPLGMVLCGDAVLRGDGVVGDPTEAALVVLAAKVGVDADDVRRRWPRAAVVPFESDRKYMATVHRLDGVEPDTGGTTPSEETGVPLGPDDTALLFVKGAPDVVLDRSTHVLGPDGPESLDDATRQRLSQVNDDYTGDGLRVMAVAYRTLAASGPDLDAAASMEPEDLDDRVGDLCLLALVGILDPPRSEAAAAVQEAQEAGIEVHMITGDHVGTASAIARRLGIGGDALSGAELDRIDDEELRRRAPGLGVLARVDPGHKIRMVGALQADGAVVAMTGDGVNDAPALKEADIGIAMGVTGTDVAKGAARMILTDDNFATIVAAVREGRGIFDNIVKFIRFQIATAWGFVLIFLVASLFGIAGGAPFTPLQILWVNVIMDGPPAMALGMDRPDRGVMRRPPRPVQEQILTRPRILRIALSSVVMATGTIGILVAAPGDERSVGALAFTTYVLFQVFNLLNVRGQEESILSRHTFTNRWLWISIAAVLTLQVVVVHVPAAQGLFDTTGLEVREWLLAVAVASSVVWVEELRKLVSRRRGGVGSADTGKVSGR